MATFSGNPADKAIGGIPGSAAAAQRPSGMTNGTQRNSSVGSSGGGGNGGLGGSSREGGFAGAAGASMAVAGSGSRGTGSNYGAGSGLSGMAGGYGGSAKSAPSASSGMRMSGATDAASIVPGKVTFTSSTVKKSVPFGQAYPSLSGFLGGTVANPKMVTSAQVGALTGTVQKTGAYISGASTLAKAGLPASATKQLGVTTPGYGTTTIGQKTAFGTATVNLSYPKSVTQTSKVQVGSYQSTSPTSATSASDYRSAPTSTQASRMSTGPVSRGVSPAAPSRMSSGPVSRGSFASSATAASDYRAIPRATTSSRPQTVASARQESNLSKALRVTERMGDRKSDKVIKKRNKNEKGTV